MRRFSYERAGDMRDAIARVRAGGTDAAYLAGGTTLYDLMKLDIARPSTVVDISRIPALSRFDTARPSEMILGAGARMSDVAEDPRLRAEYPALAESLALAASQQLRNMATLGGNLLQRTRCPYFRGGEPFRCNKREPGSGCDAIDGVSRGQAVLGGSASCIATYPGDWAVALLIFDAQVDVIGPDGARSIAIGDLHREPGDRPDVDTTLTPGELVVGIRIPKTELGRASTYRKIRDRESYAFALASAAVAVALDGDRVTEARIALGGVATRPWRAVDAERSLVGQDLDRDTAFEVGRSALSGAQPRPGNRFKIELAANTVADALMIAKERA